MVSRIHMPMWLWIEDPFKSLARREAVLEMACKWYWCGYAHALRMAQRRVSKSLCASRWSNFLVLMKEFNIVGITINHKRCPHCEHQLKHYYFYCGQCGSYEITDWKKTVISWISIITFTLFLLYLVFPSKEVICGNPYLISILQQPSVCANQ